MLTKEERIATIGTIAFSALLLLLLFFVTFINEPKAEEEGILINFGDSEQGMGEVEPRPAVAQNIPSPPPTPTPPEPTPTQTGEEEVINQDFEESAVIEQKKKAEEKKRQEEELKRQQELEQQRIAEEQRKQEEEQRRKEEEQRRQQQQQQQINSMAQNAFAGRNANGGNSGQGNTGQAGNQGALNGDPNSTNTIGGSGNGISFKLDGRSFGSTPPKPEYRSKSEGKVVVEIRVDRSGNVIGAYPGKAGTTTTDKVLHEAARKAALEAKFNSAPNAAEIQIGTITYTFIQQ